MLQYPPGLLNATAGVSNSGRDGDNADEFPFFFLFSPLYSLLIKSLFSFYVSSTGVCIGSLEFRKRQQLKLSSSSMYSSALKVLVFVVLFM